MDTLDPVKMNFKTRLKGKEKEGCVHNINIYFIFFSMIIYYFFSFIFISWRLITIL